MVHAGGVHNTADIYDGTFSQGIGIHHRKETAVPGWDVHTGRHMLPDDFGGAFSAGRWISASCHRVFQLLFGFLDLFGVLLCRIGYRVDSSEEGVEETFFYVAYGNLRHHTLAVDRADLLWRHPCQTHNGEYAGCDHP